MLTFGLERRRARLVCRVSPSLACALAAIVALTGCTIESESASGDADGEMQRVPRRTGATLTRSTRARTCSPMQIAGASRAPWSTVRPPVLSSTSGAMCSSQNYPGAVHGPQSAASSGHRVQTFRRRHRSGTRALPDQAADRGRSGARPIHRVQPGPSAHDDAPPERPGDRIYARSRPRRLGDRGGSVQPLRCSAAGAVAAPGRPDPRHSMRPSPTSHGQAFANWVVLGARQLVMTALTAAGFVALSHILAPSEFRVYGYATIAFVVAATVGDLGLGAALIRRGAGEGRLGASLGLQLAFWFPMCVAIAGVGSVVTAYGFSPRSPSRSPVHSSRLYCRRSRPRCSSIAAVSQRLRGSKPCSGPRSSASRSCSR